LEVVRLSIRSRLRYEVRAPTTFIFAIQAAGAPGETVLSETIVLPPGVEADFIVDAQGPNRLVRFLAQPGSVEIAYEAVVEKAPRLDHRPFLGPSLVRDLPAAVLPYLFPSRYCQSDRLVDFASREFGRLPQGLGQAQAICDWIAAQIDYRAGASHGSTSAIDTLIDRAGVCRDFAHLGVALCRALDMPARAVSCYAWKLDPPDFHAVFQVFLDGQWMTFDATRLAPLEGLVQIAAGRDAADIAFASYFGQAELEEKEILVTALCGAPPQATEPPFLTVSQNAPGG
jgi:transglutaminase-like putative cysteine protease